jgi:hypothetical protein
MIRVTLAKPMRRAGVSGIRRFSVIVLSELERIQLRLFEPKGEFRSCSGKSLELSKNFAARERQSCASLAAKYGSSLKYG